MSCECYTGNNTVIQSGPGISVTGAGTVSQPYVIESYDDPKGDWTFSGAMTASPGLDLSALDAPYLVRATLTGTGTITLPTWSSGGAGTITLVLTQDGTGSRTLNFAGAGVKSSAPIVLSTTANATDVVVLLWTGAGWIATLAAKGIS